jgi:hypothetical protein
MLDCDSDDDEDREQRSSGENAATRRFAAGSGRLAFTT